MSILKIDSVIPNCKVYFNELKKYIEYLYTQNNKELFKRNAISEVQNHILDFLVTIAEAHERNSTRRIKFYRKYI